MVNLEHKLTVDDLIVEYLIYKVRNGYETSFFTSEFMDFLSFFQRKMEVEDILYENDKLFKRFFERKNNSDWSISHMEMEYSAKDKDYLIKANYKLSDYDASVINTYFMDNGMGKFGMGKTAEIRNIIREYLSSQPRRKIDETIVIDDNEIIIGKQIAALIITEIWNSHISKQIEYHQWPGQCMDINKYLFEIDLAEIINVKSIKSELIDLYNVISKRIAILYHQDRNLKVSSYRNGYLKRSNYELLVQGYENIIGIAFGEFKKALEFDLSTLTFKESHVIDDVYDWNEDLDIKTTTILVGNDNVKKLMKNLEKSRKSS